MKKVLVLLFVFSFLAITKASAYEVKLECRNLENGKSWTYIYPNKTLSLWDMLDDCLLKSRVRLEVKPGRVLLPGEQSPSFIKADGTTYSLGEKLPDIATCFTPEKSVLDYYKDFDEHIKRVVSPREDKENWFLVEKAEDGDGETFVTRYVAYKKCLKLDMFEFVEVDR